MAGSHYYCDTVTWGTHNIWRQQPDCTLYLFHFLKPSIFFPPVPGDGKNFTILTKIPKKGSINQHDEMELQSNRARPFQTVLTIVTGFLLVYYITGWQWTIMLALVLGLGSVLSSRMAERIDWVWMKIAWLFGLVIPKIILTFVYYIVLVPVALIARVVRKEPPVTLENNKKSMFRNMKKTFGKEDFKKPW